MDEALRRQLIARAEEVAAFAYAPASRFAVGAALLAADGRIFAGCNVENASYGLTMCAERNAVFHAVAEGARAFEVLAVYTPLADPGYPCGACRQVLAEFGRDLAIVLAGNGPTVVETRLVELLPHPFRFERA
jgi:cytidine deaminase